MVTPSTVRLLRRMYDTKGSLLADGLRVCVREQVVGGPPTRIYDDAGTLVNKAGVTTLTNGGYVDCYVRPGFSFSLTAYNPNGTTAGYAHDVTPGDPYDIADIPALASAVTGGGSGGGTPGDGNITRSYTNNDTFSLLPGAPVFATGVGTMGGASGIQSRRACLGVVASTDTVYPGSSALVLVEGTQVLTTQQWDAVCGTLGGLIRGSKYYLDFTNPGKLKLSPDVNNPPSNLLYLVSIGYALSPTELKLEIQPAIRIS